MFEKYANKIEYNGVKENRTKNGPNLPENHDLQETEQDLPGAPQSPRRSAISLHIPSSLAHSRRNAVRHVNCLHNLMRVLLPSAWGRGSFCSITLRVGILARVASCCLI